MRYLDKKEVFVVQLTAGRGPAECCWVVSQVLKAFIADMKSKLIKHEVLERHQGDMAGTLNSAVVTVEGYRVKEALQDWEGTIQWVGKSPFRKHHKRKNWFVGLSVNKQQQEEKLDMRSIVVQPFRASGPGGQHRNKVETAVRVTHQPTGLTVTATASRSQLQNKKEALKKLQTCLASHALEQQKSLIEDQWSEHLNLHRGNAVKIFEGIRFREK